MAMRVQSGISDNVTAMNVPVASSDDLIIVMSSWLEFVPFSKGDEAAASIVKVSDRIFKAFNPSTGEIPELLRIQRLDGFPCFGTLSVLELGISAAVFSLTM